MNEMRQYSLSNLLLAVMLAIGLVFGTNPVASAETLECSNLDIAGSYACNVACIIRGDNDGLTGFTDLSRTETDTIEVFTINSPEGCVDESAGIYKVEISAPTDNGEFTETEIGPLVGCTLYTATESVSDNQFPVLEDYIFQDSSGPANGFTKVVRNPSRSDFKTCTVDCTRK